MEGASVHYCAVGGGGGGWWWGHRSCDGNMTAHALVTGHHHHHHMGEAGSPPLYGICGVCGMETGNVCINTQCAALLCGY